MFKFDFAEAFNYPFRGLGRFFFASLMVPLAVVLIVVVVGVGLATSLGPLPTQYTEETLILVIQRLLVGGLVVLVLSLLPGALLSGYGLRATREVAMGATELPRWSNWVGLILEGVAGFAVGLGIVAVPLGALTAASISTFGPLLAPHPDRALDNLFLYLISGTGLAIVLGSVVAILLVQFILPMAMLRLAVHRSILAGLNPLGIARDIAAAPFDYLLYQAVIFGVGWVTHAAMAFVPPLFLLSLPLMVYLQLLSANLLGQYYRRHLLPASDRV